MKKTVVTLLAVSLLVTAQAKILRVNNVGGTAPYSSIQAAIRLAEDGDTIMVDGSPEEYGKTTLNKRVVLIGPGFFLREDGITTEADREARVDGLEVQVEGTVIKGMRIGGWYSLEIKAPRVVVTRCYIGSWEGIKFCAGADNCTLHQNFIVDNIVGDGKTYYHQITNNICKQLGVANVYDSYIYYNTVYGEDPLKFHSATDNRIAYNFVRGKNFDKDDQGNSLKDNTYLDNLAIDDDELFDGIETDLDVQNSMKQLSSSVSKRYGAFAGTAPYILAGVPTAPVIENVDMPASVEQGSKMCVTIKLGQGR